MRHLKLAFFSLAFILFGCQQAELVDPDVMEQQPMKTVTISAGMDVDTKASLDSETGAFTWQSGDLISVLATDGKFYDFILSTGAGEKEAEFTGSIPETANVTTVATYPRIVANGADNTVLSGNTLSYTLPSAWTYAAEVSNVPMIAAFGEGAEDMSFKQVGGVMRFPVKNLPTEATFVVTMHDKTITGAFPVDITNLGETAMTAGTEASTLTISYSSEVDGASAEFNVPVPTGVYNNFNVSIKDAEGNVLLSKDYSAENTVNRATLLNMKELVLPERPMVISEVWPFFVDARVVFSKYEGVTHYAVYVDGSETPVIVEAEDLGETAGFLVGGEFAHNSTHTVAVAKVVGDEIVASSKSSAVEFTTASIHPLTTNTGTKFVAVGWDDVAIGKENAPVYDPTTRKWSTMPSWDKCENGRVYQVQLYAADQTTLLYDHIPFSGYETYMSPYGCTANLAKINDSWTLFPTALTFCWLEPDSDYYFRVRTVEGVEIGLEQGNHNPDATTPAVLSADRGESGWSEFVKLSTEAEVQITGNLIMHEGFDDMMLNDDYMNWSIPIVPDLSTEPMTRAEYEASLAVKYPEFLASSPTPTTSKWTNYGCHNTWNKAHLYGMFDDDFVAATPRFFNEVAGSLEGWSVTSGKESDGVIPAVGAIRLGNKYKQDVEVILASPAIDSDLLYDDVGTKCIITMQVSTFAGAIGVDRMPRLIQVKQWRGISAVSEETYDIGELYPEQWASDILITSDVHYTHHHSYYEVKHELYLRNGDIIEFIRPKESLKQLGCIVLGDIKIEAVPGDYESGITNPEDTGIGTEPDDTNYDVYGLGEFPISHWYTVEPWSYANSDGTYDDELTKARYQEMKDAGINMALYMGHKLNHSIEEQKRILGVCEEVGLKFIGSMTNGGAVPGLDVIPQIKEQLATSEAYVGDYISDEPNVSEFDSFVSYVNEFRNQIPDKDVYINLFPQYARQNDQLGTDYETYIDQYLAKVNTKALSYDYYGLNKNGDINNDYFSNLDLVRSKTLDVRKPFWVITQAGQVGSSTRMPTEVEQRWNVWSTIALGSKGISYFCYWTPDSQAFNETPYMIDLEGNKTVMYDYIKKINADINTIGKKLLPCHADGGIMTSTTYYPLYDNNESGRTKYGPIQGVTGSQSILCGCFRDARKSENGENYKGYKALVVSEMPSRDVEAYLALETSISQITFTHNNTTQTVEITNTLNTTVGSIAISYDGATLTLGIPSGEAILLEF